MTIRTRFWANVDLTAGPMGCWPWTGARSRFGYGRMVAAGRVNNAHRVAWQLAFGPIPDGLCVLHRCDNPPCCNPLHLFVGTKRDNARDMAAKGRAHYQQTGYLPPVHARGERVATSKLVPRDVLEIRSAHQEGEAIKSIARRFGVRPWAVKNILRGVTWRHV